MLNYRSVKQVTQCRLGFGKNNDFTLKILLQNNCVFHDLVMFYSLEAPLLKCPKYQHPELIKRF